MNFKNILPFVFYSLLIASISLMAQSTDTAVPAVHVGRNNFYKLGTPDDPVSAAEFRAFLCAKNIESHENYTFYDPSFMTTSLSWFSRSSACIEYHEPMLIRMAPISMRYPEEMGIYQVIAGRENYIIDGVQSQLVQNEFAAWRQNPQATELRDYMNAEISGDTQTSQSIKDKYSKTNPPIFDQLTHYAKNYNVFSKTPQWYYVNENATPYIGDKGTFLFFDYVGISYASTDIHHRSQRYFDILCDDRGVDEFGNIIFERGTDPASPVNVEAREEYSRPSLIRVSNSLSWIYSCFTVVKSDHLELMTSTDPQAEDLDFVSQMEKQ